MKNIAVYLLMAIALMSCKKENLLEDVVLAPNEYENSENRYVTVKNIYQINCTTVGFDIVIHTELLPKDIRDNINDYKVIVENPFGKRIFAIRLKDQWVATRCNTLNKFKISLYKKWPERESEPFEFEFRTSD